MNMVVNKDEIGQLQPATNMLEVIERAAMNPDVDVDKMRALLDMKMQIDAKDAEMIFNRALNKCQSEIGRVAANKENKQTHSQYADYAALDRVVRPVYTKYGFSLSFNTGESAAEVVKVICYVSHEDGHTRTYSVDMPADGKGAKGGDVMTKTHAAGSAMQYGQRYLLKLIFNVAIGQDDDGNGAGAKAATITEEQAATMQALAEEVGANKEGFFKYLSTKCKKEITAYTDIPAMSYESAIKALEGQRNKK